MKESQNLDALPVGLRHRQQRASQRLPRATAALLLRAAGRLLCLLRVLRWERRLPQHGAALLVGQRRGALADGGLWLDEAPERVDLAG